MLPLNRETMTMVAIAVALAAIFYMYKETQKMKNDISECQTTSVGLAHKIASVQAPAREVNAEGPTTPPEEKNED
tara:strand:+ start:375 stop:599 length:225 start_codon:yes stop_codon:yes gene_type:complete